MEENNNSLTFQVKADFQLDFLKTLAGSQVLSANCVKEIQCRSLLWRGTDTEVDWNRCCYSVAWQNDDWRVILLLWHDLDMWSGRNDRSHENNIWAQSVLFQKVHLSLSLSLSLSCIRGLYLPPILDLLYKMVEKILMSVNILRGVCVCVCVCMCVCCVCVCLLSSKSHSHGMSFFFSPCVSGWFTLEIHAQSDHYMCGQFAESSCSCP